MGTKSMERSSTQHSTLKQNELWPWIRQILQTGDYGLLAEWLRTMEAVDHEDGHIRLTLKTAVQICHICLQQQEELEVAWETYERYARQEEVLADGLSSLLKLLFLLFEEGPAGEALEGGIEGAPEKRPFASGPAARLAASPGLWQRLQGLVSQLTGGEPAGRQAASVLLPASEGETAVPFYIPEKHPRSQPSHPASDKKEGEPAEDLPDGERASTFSAADRELLHDIRELLHSQNQLLLSATSLAGNTLEAPQEESGPVLQLDGLLTSAPVTQTGSADTEVPTKFETSEEVPSLTVYTLGAFRAYQDDQLIEDLTSSKSWSVLKYLLVNRKQPTAKEVLMDMFWPDAAPDAARNNLNVAIYHLRKTLRDGYHDFSHILYQDDHYALNSEMKIWVDAEDFAAKFRLAQAYEGDGRYEQALELYHAAESIYQGEFLAEDRYEDWLLFLRQRYQSMYLRLLERLGSHYYARGEYNMSIRFCRQILLVDPCDEEAHQQIMRGYYRLGQHYLALRQYHQCTETLEKELAASPTPETARLVSKIRNHEEI